MKKMLSLILLLMACLAFVFFTKEKEIKISIPFDYMDINSIEIYNYNISKSAKKKLVTKDDDISDIYKKFSNILVSSKKIESTESGKKIIFKFNLLDGKSYEIIYMAKAVKSGIIVIPSEGLKYFSKSDILGLWDNYNYDELDVSESELNLYEQE